MPAIASDASGTLAPRIAGDVQGIVVSGYATLPFARALFLDCTGAPGGGWLKTLRKSVSITPADGPQTPAAMIAFTATGLARIGVTAEALATFQTPFQEGMLQDDRRRRLGDDEAEPCTITPGGLRWSGNSAGQTRPTDATVHALLVLYEASADALASHAQAVSLAITALGVTIPREKELDLRLDSRGIAREHFGFADGISQPVPYDATMVTGPRDAIHGVPLGDILLGYPNAHGEVPPGPVVAHPVVVQPAAMDAAKLGGPAEPAKVAAPAPSPLAPIDDTAGLLDLGLNGSYLVVRELRQDVAAFWTSLDREAANLNARAGAAAPAVTAGWLAERVVGRDVDGHLLGPAGPCPPLPGGLPDNAPLFFQSDRHGFGCPIGSHVRRANPRDGLAAKAADCPNLLDAANAHRILRRGRKFGDTAPDDPRVQDGKDRGLLFMCLNTDIVRQFEFVQQNWILNPNFATLYKEVDPLIGPKGKMTLPRTPLRRTVDVETYVTLTGGDYFFLPSLRALAYLETLTG